MHEYRPLRHKIRKPCVKEHFRPPNDVMSHATITCLTRGIRENVWHVYLHKCSFFTFYFMYTTFVVIWHAAVRAGVPVNSYNIT